MSPAGGLAVIHDVGQLLDLLLRAHLTVADPLEVGDALRLFVHVHRAIPQVEPACGQSASVNIAFEGPHNADIWKCHSATCF